MRIGIFFGGPSREREISYLGGKTAFENLDKQLFTPVLVFVDSLGRFILVNESQLYHANIRAFYPPASYQTNGFEVYVESLKNQLSANELNKIMHEIGTPILPQDFKQYFDFAFIIVHGPDCEDGAIQGLLEWHRMPYLGPGLLGSAVSIDKILQNEQIARANGQQKKMRVLRWENWHGQDKKAVFEAVKADLGLPIVLKAPHQGSSIGVAIVRHDNLEAFEQAMGQCFFSLEIDLEQWQNLNETEQRAFAQKMANLDEGIGFPAIIQETNQTIHHPQELIETLNQLQTTNYKLQVLSANAEDQVLLEEFIEGQEFSCGVIQDDDGTVIALPPTEIVKPNEEVTFDFKTKYKLNVTRKRLPVQTTLENNLLIQHNIELVFEKLGMNVIARIDGFLTPDGRVLLHDPNTLPGMSPASLIFKQMGEIGLNITKALTYLVRQSLRERIRTGKNTVQLRQLLHDLDKRIAQNIARTLPEQILEFDATDEAFAQARKKFGQINATGTHQALPILKVSDSEKYTLPVHLMFKDYVEDVLVAINQPRHPLVLHSIEKAQHIIRRLVG